MISKKRKWVKFSPGTKSIIVNLTAKSAMDYAKSTKKNVSENDISFDVIGLAMEIHTELGPGLLESAYKECLFHKLNKSGFQVQKEKSMPLIWQEVKLDCGYRIDLLVEDKLVVEIKSVTALNDVHLAQTLTYLKLGLLINFNVLRLKTGIKRVVNELYP